MKKTKRFMVAAGILLAAVSLFLPNTVMAGHEWELVYATNGSGAITAECTANNDCGFENLRLAIESGAEIKVGAYNAGLKTTFYYILSTVWVPETGAADMRIGGKRFTLNEGLNWTRTFHYTDGELHYEDSNGANGSNIVAQDWYALKTY